MKNLIDQFSTYLRDERRASPHTLKNYLVDLVQFTNFMEKNYPQTVSSGKDTLGKVDVSMVREYMSHMFEGRTASSMARKLASLRTFFGYCQREGVVLSNPAKSVATPKIPKRLPKFLTVDEVYSLLASPCVETSLGSRDRAILELLYASGLRVSELVALETDHVDLSVKNVRVAGKGRKERIVPIGEKACTAVSEYLGRRGEIVRDGSKEKAMFVNRQGGRLSCRSVERLLSKYMKKSGM